MRSVTTDHLGGLLQAASSNYPNRIAVKEYGGRSMTYAELERTTNQLANALLIHGLHPGDRLATWMSDCVEYIQFYFALAKAGFVLTPISPRFSAKAAARRVENAGARMVFYNDEVKAKVGDLAELCPDVPLFHCERLGELIADAPHQVFPPPNDETLFVLAQTSGTSGPSKTVMLSQRAVKTVARTNAVAYGLRLGSIGVSVGSLSFDAKIPSFVMSHVYVGGTIVLLGDADSETHIAAIEEERGTYTNITTGQLLDFVERAAFAPDRIASLRSVLHGSSKAPAEDLARLADVLGERLIEGWGVIESSGGLVTATVPGDLAPGVPLERFATAGRPVPEALVEIVDEDEQPLPHDGQAIGELLIRTPTLMTGYWHEPELTHEVMANGWFKTGDLGAIGADGYVRVVDRKPDVIAAPGGPVYPHEVESVINHVPGVAACAVVADASAAGEQAVVAVIVRRPGADVDTAGVIARCRAKLPAWFVPTRVWFVDDLPYADKGTIRRVEVRARLAELSKVHTSGNGTAHAARRSG